MSVRVAVIPATMGTDSGVNIVPDGVFPSQTAPPTGASAAAETGGDQRTMTMVSAATSSAVESAVPMVPEMSNWTIGVVTGVAVAAVVLAGVVLCLLAYRRRGRKSRKEDRMGMFSLWGDPGNNASSASLNRHSQQSSIGRPSSVHRPSQGQADRSGGDGVHGGPILAKTALGLEAEVKAAENNYSGTPSVSPPTAAVSHHRNTGTSTLESAWRASMQWSDSDHSATVETPTSAAAIFPSTDPATARLSKNSRYSGPRPPPPQRQRQSGSTVRHDMDISTLEPVTDHEDIFLPPTYDPMWPRRDSCGTFSSS